MLHHTHSKLRRSPAVRVPGEGKGWEYCFRPAEDLHAFCLERLGLSRREVWAVGVDYFRFCLRNGNTVLAGTALDRMNDRYRLTLPVEPGELSAVEMRLGYHRDGEYKRTFRTVTVFPEDLEGSSAGRSTVFWPVWRSYLEGQGPAVGFRTAGGGQTGCQTAYSDRLF